MLTQYCSDDQTEKNKMDKACRTYGERKGVYRVVVGKPDGKRPRGRPRHRWGIILRWIFRKWGVGVRTGSSWLKTGTSGWNL
jgi:hypothetical protein